MDRLLFLLVFVAIGALSYGWWRNDHRIVVAQQEKIQQFMAAGGRFTANDGKELCEFTNRIAEHSIGFQKSGLPLLDCEKYLKK